MGKWVVRGDHGWRFNYAGPGVGRDKQARRLAGHAGSSGGDRAGRPACRHRARTGRVGQSGTGDFVPTNWLGAARLGARHTLRASLVCPPGPGPAKDVRGPWPPAMSGLGHLAGRTAREGHWGSVKKWWPFEGGQHGRSGPRVSSSPGRSGPGTWPSSSRRGPLNRVFDCPRSKRPGPAVDQRPRPAEAPRWVRVLLPKAAGQAESGRASDWHHGWRPGPLGQTGRRGGGGL